MFRWKRDRAGVESVMLDRPSAEMKLQKKSTRVLGLISKRVKKLSRENAASMLREKDERFLPEKSTIARTPGQFSASQKTQRTTRTQPQTETSIYYGSTIELQTRLNQKIGRRKLRSEVENTAQNRTEDQICFNDLLDRHYDRLGPGIHKVKYSKQEFYSVIAEANAIFVSEKTLVDVDPPCVVVGDLHGQFNDLINMFLLIGRPPETVYVFTGDYVDRGMMSIECIMLLFTYKICYPENIFLLRGNHEIARVNKKYGFYDECITSIPKFGEDIWAEFQRCFNNLPISALIATKILCMHGGLSPSMVTIDDLREHPKPIRNPFRGIVNDMLWSDPDLAVFEWRTSSRGSGFIFGTNVVDDICTRLGLELIIRAHQMCFDGYWTMTNRKLITIFSAPLYCNLYKNAGCVLKVDRTLCIQPVFFVPESVKLEKIIEQKNRVWDDSFDDLETC